MSQIPFSATALSAELVANLATLGYDHMTEIQARALPVMLEGRDVIAQAKTGSGKTAAFGLALLHRLNVSRFRVQTLVVCPTRELADQVAVEIRKLARSIHNIKVLTLCGGAPIGPQIGSLEHGAHIIVGTPGRIEEHLEQGRLSLAELNTLVLDEADRMLEMGFEASIEAIVSRCPATRQTLLFSATYPPQIAALAEHLLQNPETVVVEAGHDQQSISQHFYELTDDSSRLEACQRLLLHFNPLSAVIFCNTKADCQTITDALSRQGFDVAALHGDLEQKDRDQTLVKFANQSCTLLVATDVAARGIDIDHVQLVINYQLAHDPEVHVHRVGRTGRAGNQGHACSLYSYKDVNKLLSLQSYLNTEFQPEPLPAATVSKPTPAPMVTLQIDGGKKAKLRPGDILGALTANQALSAEQIGKIKIAAISAYVAVERRSAQRALTLLSEGKLKGRSFRARKI